MFITVVWFLNFSFLSHLSSEIKVLEADMLDLPFSDGCFDVVIEKGTMVNREAIPWFFLVIFQFNKIMMHIYSYSFLPFTFKDVLFVNSGDPWNPRPATVTQVKAMLDGIHRVLKPDGIFISISFGQVEQKKFIFPSLDIEGNFTLCHSYSHEIHLCSHTLGALYLMLKNIHGPLNGVPLVMGSIIFSISWGR